MMFVICKQNQNTPPFIYLQGGVFFWHTIIVNWVGERFWACESSPFSIYIKNTLGFWPRFEAAFFPSVPLLYAKNPLSTTEDKAESWRSQSFLSVFIISKVGLTTRPTAL